MERLADFIYGAMHLIGYRHPIHPALVHMPIGLVVGAVVFIFAAPYFKNRALDRAAFYALILAFLFYFPTAFMGIMDWQHFYAGAWIFVFKMKLALAALLLVLLIWAIYLSVRNRIEGGAVASWWNKAVHVLLLLNVVGLGYFGGQIVYGGQRSIKTTEYKVGAAVFEKSCAACHAGGGNIIDPKLPVIGAPQLDNEKAFIAWLRNPNKSPHIMLRFPVSRISDAQAAQLRGYIVNVLEKPRGK